jgi:hypothetical protein
VALIDKSEAVGILDFAANLANYRLDAGSDDGRSFALALEGIHMTQRVDDSRDKKSIREFLRGLGEVRSSVDLVLEGYVIARLVPPTEMTAEEKRQVLDEGLSVLQRVDLRTKGMPASVINDEVRKAVQEVRARNAKRRR